MSMIHTKYPPSVSPPGKILSGIRLPPVLSPKVRQPPTLQDAIPQTSSEVEEIFHMNSKTIDIGRHLADADHRLRSISVSAPVRMSSSIGITKQPYELLLLECFETFIKIKKPQEKINIDEYNKLFIEFILYEVYNTFKSSSGENISDFYSVIEHIENYINHVHQTFIDICNTLDQYDTFKEYFDLRHGPYSTSGIQIKGKKINELDLLLHLITTIRRRLIDKILNIENSINTYIINIGDINITLTNFGATAQEKLEIWLLFDSNIINQIFDRINIRNIFLKLTGLTMREHIKEYYKKQSSDYSQEDILNLLQNHTDYVDKIKKIFCFFETIYFFYKETIILLNTEEVLLHDYKSSIERSLLLLKDKSLKLKSDYSRVVSDVATTEVIEKGLDLYDSYQKIKSPIYEKEISDGFTALASSLKNESASIRRRIGINALQTSNQRLKQNPLFRSSVERFDPKIPDFVEQK